MNLPNKLTVLRMILVPPFVVILLSNCFGDASRWVALAIFIAASLTDMADGKIARKYGLVTNFGKFMDPLADKTLVCSALICLTSMGKLPAWMVIVIVIRDFAISGFRLLAADSGVVIAANYWGKFKTTFQMIMICLLLCEFPGQIMSIATIFCEYASLFFSIVSLAAYIKDNPGVLSGEM